jgi:hypothetical protein
MLYVLGPRAEIEWASVLESVFVFEFVFVSLPAAMDVGCQQPACAEEEFLATQQDYSLSLK